MSVGADISVRVFHEENFQVFFMKENTNKTFHIFAYIFKLIFYVRKIQNLHRKPILPYHDR
jgi:hypothetical protein